jgi:short-subunit dehydrogenase
MALRLAPGLALSVAPELALGVGWITAMRLADASVLVTGASGGIGAATAVELHRRGARLVVHGRDRARLQTLADGVGGRCVLGDLSGPDGPAEVAEQAGPVDILVHCAGAGLRSAVDAVDGADVDRLIAVNLRAPMLLTQALLPEMLRHERGHVAFVASIAGHTAVALEAVYSATKGGLLLFADSLRLELAGTGVTVSTVSPGAVATGFWVARGVPYHRRSPRPVPAEAVARVLVDDIERGGGDRIVPRWLGVAPRVRAIQPRLYRWLAGRLDPSGQRR